MSVADRIDAVAAAKSRLGILTMELLQLVDGLPGECRFPVGQAIDKLIIAAEHLEDALDDAPVQP